MLSLALGAAALVFSQPAQAAVDQFFCIPSVTGTCTIVASNPGGTLLRANGWIKVNAIGFGASNVPPANDPYAPGAAAPGPVEIVKPLDETSPTWFLTALQGTPVELRLAWRKAGGVITTVKPYMQAKYTGVRLTVSQMQQDGDDPPQERLTFERPSGLVFEYWKQKSDGTLITPPLTTTWTAP